ncbi:MAG: lipid A Kdo2 1-phosphate O-methyltransferase [Gemmatimonadaceae bacterium]
MPLREEFEETGNWLFHRRSYLPLLIIAFVLAAMPRFEYPRREHWRHELWEGVCLSVSFIGLVIRAATVGWVPGGTSGRNTTDGQVAERLNTTGMYSLVRHPLYLGNFMIWLGLVLIPRSAWMAIVVVLVYWLYYERIAFAEEEFLRRRFGEEYIAWATHTPAFIPRISSWRRPPLPFSMRTVLRREYSGLFAVTLLFAALDAASGWVATGRIALDFPATVIVLSGLACYLVLLTLKRRTQLLHVAGR